MTGVEQVPALASFVPLYDPLFALFPGMGNYWLWLVIPLVVVVSVVYKGTRVASLKTLAKDATRMSVELMAVMAFAGVVLALGHWVYLHLAGPLVR
jgi:hypothetical protein